MRNATVFNLWMSEFQEHFPKNIVDALGLIGMTCAALIIKKGKIVIKTSLLPQKSSISWLQERSISIKSF